MPFSSFRRNDDCDCELHTWMCRNADISAKAQCAVDCMDHISRIPKNPEHLQQLPGRLLNILQNYFSASDDTSQPDTPCLA